VTTFFDAPGFPPRFRVSALGTAGYNAWFMGRADTARERIGQTIAAARESNSPFDLASAQFFAAVLNFLLREPGQAETVAAQAVAISDEHGFPFFAAYCRIYLGWARAHLGHAGEGVALIRQGLAGLSEIGTRIAITLYLICLAEGQALDGATAEALATIEEALEENPEVLLFRPEALRVRGELRLRTERTELAEADFREAITLAQRRGIKSWQLRATTSLSRMLAKQGKRDEARAMLAKIYGWFTEGFDTADLKDAKTLLDELSM
jgi:predicted ATPase